MHVRYNRTGKIARHDERGFFVDYLSDSINIELTLITIVIFDPMKAQEPFFYVARGMTHAFL